MDNKTCTVCNIEKQINKFYKRYSEGKDCNIKRGVKRYSDNKGKLSIQQKNYYEKTEINNREIKWLQKQKKHRL